MQYKKCTYPHPNKSTKFKMSGMVYSNPYLFTVACTLNSAGAASRVNNRKRFEATSCTLQITSAL